MEDTNSSQISTLRSPSRDSSNSPSWQKNLSPDKRRATDTSLYGTYELNSPRRGYEYQHKTNTESTGTERISFSAKKRAVQFGTDVDPRQTQRQVSRTSSSKGLSYTGDIDVTSSSTYFCDSGRELSIWNDTSYTARKGGVTHSYRTDLTNNPTMQSLSDRETSQRDNPLRKTSSSPFLDKTRDIDLVRNSGVARDASSPLSDALTDSSWRDSFSGSVTKGTRTSGRYETDLGIGQKIETPRRQKIDHASRGASPEAEIARRGYFTAREIADLQERAMNTPPRETKKVVALKTENEDLRNQLKKSQMELERVQKQLSEKDKKMTDLERKMNERIAVLEERAAKAPPRETQRAAALKTENEDLRDQLKKSQMELERVQKQLSDKDKYIQTLERETNEKSADLQELTRHIKKLNQASEDVKGKDEQIEQLTQELKKRENEMAKVLKLVRALQRENKRLKDSAIPLDAVERYELELAHVFKHTDALSKKYYELLTHIEKGVAQGLISDEFSFDEFLFFQTRLLD